MPQGDPRLQEKFGSDDVAWDILFKAGFTAEKFIIRPPAGRRKWDDLSTDEKEAIEYLCDEWDWAWAGFR